MNREQGLATIAKLSPALQRLVEEAEEYLKAAKAQSTVRAYDNDWSDWTEWCARHSLQALPAEPAALVLYLTEAAQKSSPATIKRRLVAISQHHRAAGHESPTKASNV